jgi:hypothetical protein
VGENVVGEDEDEDEDERCCFHMSERERERASAKSKVNPTPAAAWIIPHQMRKSRSQSSSSRPTIVSLFLSLATHQQSSSLDASSPTHSLQQWCKRYTTPTDLER